MKNIIEEIKNNHRWHPPLPKSELLMQAFERTTGLTLPPDFKEFYMRCGRADLFESGCMILPLTEIQKASIVLLADESEDWCPGSWYAFCDMNDGDFAGLDLSSVQGNAVNVLDLNHDEIGRCTIIARSFTEFLERALRSSGRSYWLDKSFQDYGIVQYENPPGYYRRVDARWWSSLGPEQGPEKCDTPACGMLRIEHSTKCRRHHYEMVQGRQCPFDK
jgi:hypothetical protein